MYLILGSVTAVKLIVGVQFVVKFNVVPPFVVLTVKVSTEGTVFT